MSGTYHDFPALMRTGKPHIIVPYYFPYQQLSPAFPEVLPRSLNRIWCFTRQKFAAFPEVLIEHEGKGNNVTWTWESWRSLVFQYTGYLNLAQRDVEFNQFGSVDLFEPRISALVATEKKIALDYQRWCMCFSQKDHITVSSP